MVTAGGGVPGLVRQLHALRLQFGRRQLARRGWFLQLPQNFHGIFESVDFVSVVIKAPESAATQDDFMRPPTAILQCYRFGLAAEADLGEIQSFNFFFFFFCREQAKIFVET